MTMTKLKRILLAAALGLPFAGQAMAQTKIEGLHVWTSASEVGALKVITDKLKTMGFEWQDSAVGGANGANAQQALRTRVAAGNPPAVMQFLGFEGLGWAKEGVLRSLNDLYAKNGWKDALPPVMLQFLQQDDTFFSTPINMHRQNWVWANKAVFDKAGIAIPTSWDELIASAEKLKAIGVTPIAMSDESWQIEELFESMLIDVNGPDFYKKAAIDLDETALSSPEMIKTFELLGKVRGLHDAGFTGRDWAAATNLVANGQAGMQIMGDWAKGEFLAKGMKPGVDFLCFPTPTATPNYKFVFDTFGGFKIKNADIEKGQDAVAEAIMDPEVQKKFNLIKGSIPARLDVPMDDFDDCAKRSFSDRVAAIKNNAIYGSLTDGFAVEPRFSGVFQDVVGKFFVTDMSAEDAVKSLVDGINNAR
ncbi:carbohydrate ABC transporter substrate-binding protein [bacterium M00.F.Ca.ET.230.01.1.1]|nr:carbohydrate ABC transporter substrate-binding protein [Mesorhizobium sp. M2A.F.Ca.ET.067.02.1.1]TGP50797.1 carbohydrate ABC transporter substrate-binding protein [bacterium M00.F.Ca.ET.230.01.1.1]TGT53716.1 carbohydrate ABC transporter substrate-binding protein [Mesorhizobium sp. M00.F.Ca.ET.170.01.1.1]TIU59234.1 MAG: extracellular solute-binding protein [Mesorhizobium sp.]